MFLDAVTEDYKIVYVQCNESLLVLHFSNANGVRCIGSNTYLLTNDGEKVGASKTFKAAEEEMERIKRLAFCTQHTVAEFEDILLSGSLMKWSSAMVVVACLPLCLMLVQC